MTINTIPFDGFEHWLAHTSVDNALAELPDFVTGWPDRVQWVIYGLSQRTTTASQRDAIVQHGLAAMKALAKPHADIPANVSQALHVFEQLAEQCNNDPTQRAKLTQAGFDMLPDFVQAKLQRADVLLQKLAQLNAVTISEFTNIAGYAGDELWLISAPVGQPPINGFAQSIRQRDPIFYLDGDTYSAKALLAKGGSVVDTMDPASDLSFRSFAYTMLARQHETNLPSLGVSAHARIAQYRLSHPSQLVAA